jgi:hypothetical protein
MQISSGIGLGEVARRGDVSDAFSTFLVCNNPKPWDSLKMLRIGRYKIQVVPQSRGPNP